MIDDGVQKKRQEEKKKSQASGSRLRSAMGWQIGLICRVWTQGCGFSSIIPTLFPPGELLGERNRIGWRIWF